MQLAAGPSSFWVLADFVPQLDVLADDCDIDKLAGLLVGQSASAWQRAAYLLDRGGRNSDAVDLAARCGGVSNPVVSFGSGPIAVWSPQFSVNDRLVAPLQQQLGKV